MTISSPALGREYARGARHDSRPARISDPTPSGQNSRGQGRAQAHTRSLRRRISVMSRGSLTAPARHTRVLTSLASPIHTTPPGVLTRRSSACTGPRSRGGSTPCSCTACPWTPARRNACATVRASTPHVTTMTCRGQPCAISVTTRGTVAAGVRRRDDAVPLVMVKVFRHWVQMNRFSSNSSFHWRVIQSNDASSAVSIVGSESGALAALGPGSSAFTTHCGST